MDIAPVVERFWQDGIVVLEDFFPRGPMDAVAAALDALLARVPDKPFGGGEEYGRRFETRVRVWHAKEVPACLEVLVDPRFDQLAEAICGAGWKQSGVGIFSTPKGCGQGWHQDSRDTHPAHFELNRIVFPRDVDPAQGELLAVPGSYRRGTHLPPGGNHDPLPGEQRYAPKAGTLVLMHTRTFHRVAPNATDRPRTQFNARVMPAESPDDVCAYPVFRQGFWCFKTARPE